MITNSRLLVKANKLIRNQRVVTKALKLTAVPLSIAIMNKKSPNQLQHKYSINSNSKRYLASSSTKQEHKNSSNRAHSYDIKSHVWLKLATGVTSSAMIAWMLYPNKAIAEEKTDNNWKEKSWLVKEYNINDGIKESYLDDRFVFNAKNIVEHAKAMGEKEEHKLVIYHPERLALHEVIIQLTIGYRFKNEEELRSLVNKIYKEHVKPSIATEERKNEFIREYNEISNRVDKIIRGSVLPFDHDILNLVDATTKLMLKQLNGNRVLDIQQSRRLRNQLKEIVTNQVYKNWLEARVQSLVGNEFEKIAINENLKKLTYRKNHARIAYIIIGGPASGKGHLTKIVENDIGDVLWEDICKINPDYYKELLLSDSDAAKINIQQRAAITHLESSTISKLILARLQKQVMLGTGPHLLFDAVKPSTDKNRISAYGGATANLYVASCPADIAIYRAYDRGKKTGRFVPVNVILNGHKQQSEALPISLSEQNVFLRIYNTHVSDIHAEPKIISSIDDFGRELKISDMMAMFDFVQKASINSNAKSEAALYTKDDEKLNQKVKQLLKYVYVKDGIDGVSLKFENNNKTFAIFTRNIGLVITDNAAFINSAQSEENAQEIIQGFMRYRPDLAVAIHRGSGGEKLFVSKGEIIEYFSPELATYKALSPVKITGETVVRKFTS